MSKKLVYSCRLPLISREHVFMQFLMAIQDSHHSSHETHVTVEAPTSSQWSNRSTANYVFYDEDREPVARCNLLEFSSPKPQSKPSSFQPQLEPIKQYALETELGTSTLCEQCKKVRPAYHDGEDARCLIQHYGCFEDLIRSARTGCPLCESLRPYIEARQARGLDPIITADERKLDKRLGLIGVDEYTWTKRNPWEDAFSGPIHKTGDGSVYRECRHHYWQLKSGLQMQQDQEQFDEYPDDEWIHMRNIVEDDIFSWLFTVDERAFGPEQIWIECRHRGGSIATGAGQREVAWLMRVSLLSSPRSALIVSRVAISEA